MQNRSICKRRIAAMNEDGDDAPLGIALFLSSNQLAQLGIDPDTTDVVEYWVEDGRFQVQSDKR